MLEKVFGNFEQGFKLPEAEEIFQSMMVNFLEREQPLHLYHKKFIATQLSKQQFLMKDKNDEPGQTMKFAQKIRGKFIPKKQNSELQVFPSQIPDSLQKFKIEMFVEKQL